MKVMLDDYFSGFRMMFSTNSHTTEWSNLEIGIPMDCTISPILFVMAMEVILAAAAESTAQVNVGGRCYMPHLKTFTDNTTIMCPNEDEARLYARVPWCLNGIMQDDIQTKVSQSLSKERLYRCADDVHSSQSADTKGSSRIS